MKKTGLESLFMPGDGGRFEVPGDYTGLHLGERLHFLCEPLHKRAWRPATRPNCARCPTGIACCA